MIASLACMPRLMGAASEFSEGESQGCDFWAKQARRAPKLCTPCASRAHQSHAVWMRWLTCFSPLAAGDERRAQRAALVTQSVLPAICCRYIQMQAAQSLLLASYEPLKLCEEAMLSEAWIVPCTVGFLLKIAS